MASQKIIFGAGCFWGVEAAFRRINGVIDAVCGYSGGHTGNPTYEDVCSGTTGHIEVVAIEYDPSAIDLTALLDHFWRCHNPTTQDRQGADVGSQYRSVIFCHTAEQAAVAEESKTKLQASGRWKDPIVTQILPAMPFYRAEAYHQNYLAKQKIG